MSIRSIIAGNGIGINNNQRDIPIAQPPVYTNTSSAWTRPSDWPALPTLTNTSQQFSGLIAITPSATSATNGGGYYGGTDYNNYVALISATDTATITATGFINAGISMFAPMVSDIIGSIEMFRLKVDTHVHIGNRGYPTSPPTSPMEI